MDITEPVVNQGNPAGPSGVTGFRVKRVLSERQKSQIQHFEERRSKMLEEYGDFQEAKDSLEVLYESMMQDGARLIKERSNLMKMLFEKHGGGPVPEGLFQKYSPADPGDSDEDISDIGEEANEPEVVVIPTDNEPGESEK